MSTHEETLERLRYLEAVVSGKTMSGQTPVVVEAERDRLREDLNVTQFALEEATRKLTAVAAARDELAEGWRVQIDESDYPDNAHSKERHARIAELRKAGAR